MLSHAPMCSLTYALGRSLYVPLTCRSNTRTLPETRGPNFVLPTEAVSSLLEVRRLEALGADKDGDAMIAASQTSAVDSLKSGGGGISSANAEKMHLPPLDLPHVSHLDDSGASSTLPTITDEMLRQDIESRFQQAERSNRQYDSRVIAGWGEQTLRLASNRQYDSLVIAGEGEPTLRLSTLLDVVRRPIRSSSLGNATPTTIRVVTNGLGDAVPGNSNGGGCARQMKEAGVSAVSVALMTASADQYEELMMPCLSDTISRPAHEMVCDFIVSALDVGLDVEVTAVDRVEVDKAATEKLAKSLGVTDPVRWRPYFP